MTDLGPPVLVPQGPAVPSPVPSPPGGPSVVPPFPAPPAEGRSARLWLGLGLGGLALLLCCGVGTAALVGLGISATEAIGEQAKVQAGNYLDALVERDYSQAYEVLCDELQDKETRREFIDRMSDEPAMTSYRLGEFSATDLAVPAEVTHEGGQPENIRLTLEQDTSTAQLEVCGTGE